MNADYFKRELNLHILTGSTLPDDIIEAIEYLDKNIDRRIYNTFYSDTGEVLAHYYDWTKEFAIKRKLIKGISDIVFKDMDMTNLRKMIQNYFLPRDIIGLLFEYKYDDIDINYINIKNDINIFQTRS